MNRLSYLLLLASCTQTDVYETGLERAVEQTVAEQTACETFRAELDKIAATPEGDASYADKATALAVLAHLEKRPKPTAAAIEVGELLLRPPKSADRARIGAATLELKGCDLLVVYNHVKALLLHGKTLGFSEEELSRSHAAARQFVMAEASYPATLVSANILVLTLDAMAQAGAIEIPRPRMRALAELMVKTRNDLRSKSIGTRGPEEDPAGFGEAMLRETRAANKIRLAVRELME